MESDELPAGVREKVDQLRRKGDKQRKLVEVLLQKRADGTAEQRSNVDALIME